MLKCEIGSATSAPSELASHSSVTSRVEPIRGRSSSPPLASPILSPAKSSCPERHKPFLGHTFRY